MPLLDESELSGGPLIYSVIANLLVFGGAGILLASFFPIRSLVQRLPRGKSVRTSWFTLMGMTLFFTLGYLAYGIIFWGTPRAGSDLIVPVIFFFGAIFVWLSARLALETATAVRHATMLEQVVETDDLTGIFNRRYIDRRLHEELSRAERFGLPLSLLYIDLDHFGVVNNAFGRAAGDSLLSAIADRLVHAVRTSDVIARYEDDEFLILATNTPIQEAGHLAERIQKLCEGETLEGHNEAHQKISLRVTVSIGLSCSGGSRASVATLLDQARDAMRKAKQAGGSRCVACQECLTAPAHAKTVEPI